MIISDKDNALLSVSDEVLLASIVYETLPKNISDKFFNLLYSIHINKAQGKIIPIEYIDDLKEHMKSNLLDVPIFNKTSIYKEYPINQYMKDETLGKHHYYYDICLAIRYIWETKFNKYHKELIKADDLFITFPENKITIQDSDEVIEQKKKDKRLLKKLFDEEVIRVMNEYNDFEDTMTLEEAKLIVRDYMRDGS